MMNSRQFNLLDIQRAAAIKRRIAALDREIAEQHEDGYDTDMLLEERHELDRRLRERDL